jgi:hypothetical protein
VVDAEYAFNGRRVDGTDSVDQRGRIESLDLGLMLELPASLPAGTTIRAILRAFDRDEDGRLVSEHSMTPVCQAFGVGRRPPTWASAFVGQCAAVRIEEGEPNDLPPGPRVVDFLPRTLLDL